MLQRISAFFLFGLMFIAFGGIEQVVIAQPTAGLDDLVESGTRLTNCAALQLTPLTS